MVNTLKATISGSFKTTNGDIEDFQDLSGLIPLLDTDILPGEKISKAEQMIRKRYATIWVTQAMEPSGKVDADGKPVLEKKYKHVSRMREVHINSIDESDVKGNLSYVGKDIMQMNFEELQDLASAKDLSAVPLYRTGSLTHARRVAFSEYAIKVLGLPPEQYSHALDSFNPSKFQPIIADGKIRRVTQGPATPEETIDRENLVMQGKAKPATQDANSGRLTLAQLKSIADEQNIKYHSTIGWDALHAKIYGDKDKQAA